MKYIALCISLLPGYLCYAGTADTTHTGMKEHELFINTTYFIDQILQPNSDIGISPIIFGYHGFTSKHDGLRFAAGGGFTRQKSEPQLGIESTGGIGSFNVRLGYEYRYQLEKYWTFFTGFDIVANVSWQKGDDDQEDNGVNGWNFGAGPVLGIEFNITKRISLFTETEFYYLYGKNNGATTYNGQFFLPTSLFFVYRFIRK